MLFGSYRYSSWDGTQELFDIDANNQIDTTDVLAILFYLFGTATPPALGSECTPIVGCPDTCR